MKTQNKLALQISLILMGTPAGLSYAQGSPQVIESIIVTARRVEESIQEVPLAVTALSAQDLEKRNITELHDLVQRSPSVQVQASVGRAESSRLGIRGQIADDVLLTSDPAIAAIISDVPMNWSYGIGQLGTFDVGSVQVVKGPQNTLFGKNSTGGAIIISPNKPARETEGKIKFGVGNFDLRKFEGMYNAPLSESVAIRVAGAGVQRDGTLENLDAGRVYPNGLVQDSKDFRDLDNWAGRISLQWDVSDRLWSTFTIEGVETETTGVGGKLLTTNPQAGIGALAGTAFALYQSRGEPFYSGHSDSGSVPGRDQPADFNRLRQWGVLNSTSFEVSDQITVKNIFGWRDMNYLGWEDLDEVNRFDVRHPVAGISVPIQFVSASSVEAYSVTEELQILGSYDTVEWLAGIYFSHTKGFDRGNSIQGSTTGVQGQGGPAEGVVNDTSAIFAQASWHLTDRLDVTAGLRWTKDDREVTYSAASNVENLIATCLLREPVIVSGVSVDAIPGDCRQTRSETYGEPTFNLSLDYQLTENQLVYGAVRRGYRAGGFPGRGNDPFTQQPFDPETVIDVEVGYKLDTSLNGAPLRINTAIFNQDYKDIQRNITLFRNNTLQNTVGNAGKGAILGGEVEIVYYPVESVELEAFASYIKAEYDKWDELADLGGGNFGVVDRSGNEFNGVPKTSYGVTGRYYLPVPTDLGEMSIAANYYWQDDTALYVDNKVDGSGQECPGSFQKSYGLFNANFIWRDVMGSSGLDINAWGKNLNEEEYYVSGLCLYRTFGISVGYPGEPRTWGLDVSYHF